ncbi:RcpC/CpaB family pilus assembly protein [Actinomadura opuntiae]|uniref:RcpC/CpaB family pilus assembly protein n=1 Tax=Actinomadura sp. OS1-43 TaxID=604315 RepID=UPI00255AC52F|nr:RcpC/CpaB family pilus assembly protein [Actinomadura sp. OS1-43]MDL4815496.1 RcpC/CpaB family pilus assembly protein [Actinomadura sp. OS1-43]
MNARAARLRRPLAALFAAAAAGLALTALRPGAAPSVRVLAAARDLPAGTALGTADLRALDLPPPAVPAGAVRSGAAGRVLAGPMRRGEPLTDARLVGNGLLRGYGPGTVAAPVRIADAGSARLLHSGDRVDVLAGPPSAGSDLPREGDRWAEARVVVSGVPVVTVPRPHDESGQEGALVVLATDRAQAQALAGAGTALSITITGT